jgi:putative protease
MKAGGTMDNIDDLMTNLEERENAEKRSNPDRSEALDSIGGSEGAEAEPAKKRVFVGTVDHFYDKINVIAVKLTGSVRIGDVIDIENANGTVRLKVSSMQINKEEVESASEGDDVGIKVDSRVSSGSRVYREY